MLKLLFNNKSPFTKVFVYPKLPAKYDFRFVRYRGSGLANCLFVAARAFLIAQKNGWYLLNPTWGNISIGPYLRNEKDKRHYWGLFKKAGVSNFSKMFYLSILKRVAFEDAGAVKNGIIIVEGLGNYFEDLLREQENVKIFIISILQNKITSKIDNIDFTNVIGIHLRLGDYIPARRTSINWYNKIVKEIIKSYGNKYRFFVFSDGLDHELAELLSIPKVERVFFGNALSDIIALSRSKFIIGSDSTFSGWAAFLEQAPIIFPRRHFGKVLLNQDDEFIDNGDFEKMKVFLNKNI